MSKTSTLPLARTPRKNFLSRKWTVAALSFGALGMVGASISESFFTSRGYKDQKLQSTDPAYGYMWQANQERTAQGGTFFTNEWHMRSDAFPAEKESCERRVLVMGDSVPNGANLPNEALASTHLQTALRSEFSGTVTVGNISMGGWSPEHLLGYVREYGTFGADTAVYVINAEDPYQVKQWPLPARAGRYESEPRFATWAFLQQHAIGRVQNKYFTHINTDENTPTPIGAPHLDTLLSTLKGDVPHVAIVYHPRKKEMAGAPQVPEVIRMIAARHDVPIIKASYNVSDYSDRIHLSAQGQKTLAGYLKTAAGMRSMPTCAVTS